MNIAGVRQLAHRLHQGQLDLRGRPYIEHLEAVATRAAEAGATTQQQMAALLHGVIEHTTTSLDQLARLGIRPRLLAMLDALARRPSEGGDRRLNRVLACRPAVLVHRCDLIESCEQVDDRYQQEGYVRALAYLDVSTSSHPDIGSLIATVSEEEGRRWWYAVWVLRHLRSGDAVPALVATLEREPTHPATATTAGPDRRYLLRRALIGIFTGSDRTWDVQDPPDPTWVPLLEELQNHPHEDLRLMAIQLLGCLGDPRRVGSFIRALDDPAGEVQAAAAQAAGRTRSPHAFEPLLAMMENEDLSPWKRAPAAAALGEVGDPRAAQHLVTMLGATYGATAHAAARSLVKLGDREVLPAIREHLSHVSRGRHQAAWVLGEMRDLDAVDVLSAMLDDRDTWVAGYCAQALGKIGRADPDAAERAIPLLIEATHSRSTGLRWDSVWAIEGIRPDMAIEALLETAHDPFPEVRERAIRALTRCTDERATSLLIAMLPHYAGHSLARPIAKALEKSADPASLWSLREALTATTDRRTRNLIGRALASLPDGGIAGTMLLHDRDPAIRRAAVWMCTQRRSEHLDRYMRRAIRDRDQRVRQTAAEGLGRAGGPEALEILIGALEDPSHHVRAAAVSSLGKLGLQAGVPHVTRLLSDPNEVVRTAARAAHDRLLGSSA